MQCILGFAFYLCEQIVPFTQTHIHFTTKADSYSETCTLKISLFEQQNVENFIVALLAQKE